MITKGEPMFIEWLSDGSFRFIILTWDELDK